MDNQSNSSPKSISSVVASVPQNDFGGINTSVDKEQELHYDPEQGDISHTMFRLEVNVERERLMHVLAATHFMHLDWAFVLPSIILTLFSSILSFMSAGLKDETGTRMSMSVGIITLVAGTWQSMSKQLKFAARYEIHEVTAIALKRIKEKIEFTKVHFHGDHTTFIQETQRDFTQAAKRIDSSIIPLPISSAFDVLKQEIQIHSQMGNDNLPETSLTQDELLMLAYAELNLVITGFKMFPYVLPMSERSVKKALVRLRKKLTCSTCEASR
mmetsp:Transcript_44890/g.65997  ORF Transcript_44890/g.65997 Transcript_44890/m.65997 type:complete len:271 (-) Transcript_44890:159-971(-)|eukprot:CAMPEP_0195510504 /NCGR_PEP_ID=MMETSP0794_2-20130614/3133_1 /TAXON_ID=515487 /ORGANISM="Stephanopyxis turris, Strain CCMP 815" /LENGTH=270 /DNA_ID=CAMNT_0040637935 /DNA_START=297 /DNA_END=1109 /DNA_ORIENTATION=+